MNDKIRKGAEEASVLAKLATKIPLKAGRQTFGRYMGEVGELSALSEFSAEIPWPLSESVDPVGRARQRQIYRLVTRQRQR
jgi:hypothetical protein